MKKLIIALLIGVLFISCRGNVSDYPAIVTEIGYSTTRKIFYYGVEDTNSQTIYILTDSLRYKVGDTIK